MVDLDSEVLDDIRVSPYRELYNIDLNYFYGKGGADNNFSRGRYTIGADHIDNIMEKIRKLASKSESIDGFMLYHGLGGGTGSGLGALIL
jgi:hypothetical protein